MNACVFHLETSATESDALEGRSVERPWTIKSSFERSWAFKSCDDISSGNASRSNNRSSDHSSSDI